GLRHVAMGPGIVDLLRNFPASGRAQSICRGCHPVPAYCAYDGCTCSAAPHKTRQSIRSFRVTRFLVAPDLVALSLSFSSYPLAVCLPQRNLVRPQLQCVVPGRAPGLPLRFGTGLASQFGRLEKNLRTMFWSSSA